MTLTTVPRDRRIVRTDRIGMDTVTASITGPNTTHLPVRDLPSEGRSSGVTTMEWTVIAAHLKAALTVIEQIDIAAHPEAALTVMV